ncbi:MAG TPA: DUF2971 domain-containing protein [Candidatus Brocadiia bacterium]|nr:DUF2971 domain-containing protein [Candidatus Brocadiia bacterium]
MTIANIPQCKLCNQRLKDPDSDVRICRAFPAGIPPDIWPGGNDIGKPCPVNGGLAYKPVPELTYYKYRSLHSSSDSDPVSDETRRRVERIFTHRAIYFASPEELNDPFEFQLDIDDTATWHEKEEFFKDDFKKKHPYYSDSKFRLKFGEFMRRLGEYDFAGDFRKRLDEMRQGGMGVLSLVRSPSNLLTWSHYADEHRGICVQFTVTDMPHVRFIQDTHPVEYAETFPKVNPFRRTTSELAKKLALTKAKCWEYEQEHRLCPIERKGDIMSLRRSGVGTFPEGFMTGVVLGCRISKEDRDFVFDLAERHPSPVRIFEARIRPRRYALDIVQIAPEPYAACLRMIGAEQ